MLEIHHQREEMKLKGNYHTWCKVLLLVIYYYHTVVCWAGFGLGSHRCRRKKKSVADEIEQNAIYIIYCTRIHLTVHAM